MSGFGDIFGGTSQSGQQQTPFGGTLQSGQQQAPFGGTPFGTSGTTTTASGFGLGTPLLSSGFTGSGGFGATPGSFAFGSTSSNPSSFGFGATQSTGLTGFGFGSSQVTNPLSFGLTPTTTAPSTLSLGGLDSSQMGISSGGLLSYGKSDNKDVKDNLLPDEIGSTILSFQKYVKDQKAIREEISRVSSKPLQKVQDETVALKQMLSKVANELQRNILSVEKLKQESAQELKNAEIAHRTNDIPPSFQYENTAPTVYFHSQAAGFEHQMQTYRKQIEQLELQLGSLSKSTVLSPNDISTIMKNLHDTLTTMAAKLYTCHQDIQKLKEEFVHYQRKVYGESWNFDKKESTRDHTYEAKPHTAVGPSPFSNMPSAAAVAMATALNRTQQVGGFGVGSNFGNTSVGFGNISTPFKPLGSFSMSQFGNSSLGMMSSFSPSDPLQYAASLNNQKPFQLQKPPPGNKRGKRWTST